MHDTWQVSLPVLTITAQGNLATLPTFRDLMQYTRWICDEPLRWAWEIVRGHLADEEGHVSYGHPRLTTSAERHDGLLYMFIYAGPYPGYGSRVPYACACECLPMGPRCARC